MEHYLDGRVFMEKLKKRQVRLPVCILQNVIKVSYGLMVMDCKDEMEFRSGQKIPPSGMPA